MNEYIYNIGQDRIIYYTLLSNERVASYVFNKRTFKSSYVRMHDIKTDKNGMKYFKKLNNKIYLKSEVLKND